MEAIKLHGAHERADLREIMSPRIHAERNGPTNERHSADAAREDAIASLLRARLESGAITLPVSGSSMRGVIASGSEVELVAATRPRPGEIWAFIAPGETVVVHRVREVYEQSVVCRGTGNPVDDPPLPHSRAVGRVRLAVAADGRSRSFGRLDRGRADLWFRLRRLARRTRSLR